MNFLFKKASNMFSVELVTFLYDLYVFIFHVILQIVFVYEDIPILETINTVSIIFYLFLFVLLIYDKITVIYISTILEIIAFGLIGTILLGREVLFYTYNVAVIPIMAIYAYYFMCTIKKKNFIHLKTSLAFLIFFILFFSEFLFFGKKSVYLISQKAISYLFFLNSFNLITAIIFGCVLFLMVAVSINNKYEKIINENIYLATHDALTGLQNRNALNEELVILKNKNVKFGVAIADIDDFKKINDTYGHDCGDYVLKKIANILGKYPTDKLKVFRFGGEEIIFIYTNDFCVYDLFEKMRKEVNSYNFLFNKHKFRISMTFGISPLGDNFDELFKAADERLYVGKKSGKNNVIY